MEIHIKKYLKKLSYIDIFRKIISIDKELGFKINTKWIAYHEQRDVWVSKKFESFFGKKEKEKEFSRSIIKISLLHCR